MMKVVKNPNNIELIDLLQRPHHEAKQLDQLVKDVLDDVKINGDVAIKKYTSKFDGVSISDAKVTQEEFDQSEQLVAPILKDAIRKAAENIRKFHSLQKQEPIHLETSEGVECWRKSVPIEKVGLYIPGGTAPLFSTVLMLAIPAKLAGCKEVILCTPPSKDGTVHPAILFAAKLVGITQLFKIGGVQAIGAMAYGTKFVPSVFKIFGPGNQFVTAAKQMISQEGVAIDMPAGPSEVLVMADETGDADFIASDLLSQAEHGADSQVILVTTDENLIEKVQQAISEQLALLPRKEIAQKALEHSKIILVDSKETAIEVINEYGPEHLIYAVKEEDYYLEKTINAGSVFIGNYTPESAGDYASGTNHTLPTNGYAKSYSGVSLDSFVKNITFQKISKLGIQKLGPIIEVMAEAEQLQAHKNAVTIRLNKLSSEK